MPKPILTIDILKQEAGIFAEVESTHDDSMLYGASDGKAVGTYIEHKFREHLEKKYEFTLGNSAKGIDFPNLNIDLKVTRITQPQSSCPFRSARQKICGLGYALLVFVYDKTDDHATQTARLNIKYTIFVEAHRTSDYTTTRIIREHISQGANEEDLMAIFQDRNLPIDEIEAEQLAKDLLRQPPPEGYLTISNALQWRLQFSRAITVAGNIDGVQRL